MSLLIIDNYKTIYNNFHIISSSVVFVDINQYVTFVKDSSVFFLHILLMFVEEKIHKSLIDLLHLHGGDIGD